MGRIHMGCPSMGDASGDWLPAGVSPVAQSVDRGLSADRVRLRPGRLGEEWAFSKDLHIHSTPVVSHDAYLQIVRDYPGLRPS